MSESLWFGLGTLCFGIAFWALCFAFGNFLGWLDSLFGVRTLPRAYRHGSVDEGMRHCGRCLRRKVECVCNLDDLKRGPYR